MEERIGNWNQQANEENKSKIREVEQLIPSYWARWSSQTTPVKTK